MRELSPQDITDILNGSAILGAGGGGDLSEGQEMIDLARNAGKTFRLVSVDEVPDDALICTPYMLGAISALTAEEEALYADLPVTDTHPILLAYEKFQDYLGAEFYGTTPCELGGSNTATAFFPAAMNDHFIIDADPAGRAVPEITHSTYYMAGLPAAPIFTANAFGETFVLEGVKDDKRAETLVRTLSTVSRHDIAAIDHALPMRDLRDVLIKGTITRALELGAAWRQACDAGVDAAQVVADHAGGQVVFEGTVSACNYTVEDGFTLGEITIQGTGAQAAQDMRVSVKNENMACWIDGAVVATVPDLICLFDKDTQAQISNPDCTVGQSVSVVILPAPEAFRSELGLSIFGPGYAGVAPTEEWHAASQALRREPLAT